MDASVRLMICGISFVLFCILQIIVISFKTAVEHFNDNDLDALRETHQRKADQIERYYSDEHLLVISSSFLRICCGFGIVLTGTDMVSFDLSSGSMPFSIIHCSIVLSVRLVMFPMVWISFHRATRKRLRMHSCKARCPF